MDKKMENDKKRYSEISKCPLWDAKLSTFEKIWVVLIFDTIVGRNAQIQTAHM